MSRPSARRLLAVAALGAFAGCAPLTIAPAGLSFGGTPGNWSSFSQCSPLSTDPEAARMGIHSPAIQAFSRLAFANQLQARLMYAQSGMGQLEGYKRAVSGC